MKKQLVIGLMAAFCASPAFAALKVGDAAPDFTAAGSLGGKDFSFNLKTALKKGPVVVYFYPSAYTGGCDLEAHTFAEESDKFAKAGATIIGVSADDLTRLHQFSADPNFCAGKFPVASDPGGEVAAKYGLTINPPREGAKDVRGQAITHGFIPRTTFVITKDHKVAAIFSSQTDKLSPDQHVKKSLEAVRAL